MAYDDGEADEESSPFLREAIGANTPEQRNMNERNDFAGLYRGRVGSGRVLGVAFVG